MPGWTTQERKFRGRVFRVAVNPNSALLLLSRRKFAYALKYVDRAYRGIFIGGMMASAYAHFHKPLSLYRAFDQPDFHAVVHQDEWSGGAPGTHLSFTALVSSKPGRPQLQDIVDELRAVPQVREILVRNGDPSRSP